MRLTGDAARKYLEENPNAVFQDNRTGTVYNQPSNDNNILGNILQSITKPFRQGAGVAEEFGNTIGDIIKMARGENVDPNARTNEGYKYAFLNEDESQQLARDPLQTGLKSAAGIGAYAVPGGGVGATVGKRIGSAALRGAGAGALAGFGASEQGSELESILKSAGLGGLVGGALQGVGEGVGAIKNAKATKTGDEMGSVRKYLAKQRGESIGLDPNKLAKGRGTNVTSATQGEEVIDDFFNSMDDLGLSTRTSNIASKSADQGLGIYSDQFNQLLSQADNTISFDSNTTKTILDDVQKMVGNNKSVTNSAIFNEIKQNLLDLGSTYTPSQLNTVREQARNLINFAKSGKLSMSERGASAFFNSIDDTFKVALPESANVLSKMKNIYTVRPYLQGKAQLGDVIKLGTASTQLSIPTAGINEAVGTTIGKVAQKGVNLPSIPSGLGNALATGGQAAQRVAPAIAGQVAGQSQMGAQNVPTQQVQTEGQVTQNDMQAINMYLANAVLQGQISATEAKAVMELLGVSSGNSEMSANQSKATALQQSLDKLAQAWDSASGGSKLMETLGLNIGSDTRVLDQAKAAVVEDLGRLQSQGAINKDERVAFESMMPNSWDSPQVVQQKLQSIQDRINSYL